VCARLRVPYGDDTPKDGGLLLLLSCSVLTSAAGATTAAAFDLACALEHPPSSLASSRWSGVGLEEQTLVSFEAGDMEGLICGQCGEDARRHNASRVSHSGPAATPQHVGPAQVGGGCKERQASSQVLGLDGLPGDQGLVHGMSGVRIWVDSAAIAQVTSFTPFLAHAGGGAPFGRRSYRAPSGYRRLPRAQGNRMARGTARRLAAARPACSRVDSYTKKDMERKEWRGALRASCPVCVSCSTAAEVQVQPFAKVYSHCVYSHWEG